MMVEYYHKLKQLKNMPQKNDINKNLKDLSEIADWFEKKEDIDVEEGLKKVKEAVKIIKESKQRLKEIENEFEEVKKDVENI